MSTNERILFSHKREFLPYATTWMNLEDIMLSKIRQIQKDKYCMISLIHGILKKKRNKVEWWLAGTGVGEMTNNGQRVQAFYKFWASNYLQNKKEMSFWPPWTSLI